MKTRLILILALVFTTISFASLVFRPYDKSKPPTLSLPLAYDRAVVALGNETNEFHCVSATITTTFSPDGEWYFAFYSTKSNAIPKFIAIEFNGKIHLDNGLR